LLDEPVKRGDAILRFTAPKDSGVVDIQARDIGSGATAKVLVLDMHRSAWPTGLRGMFAAAGLNPGLFIGGDHEFVILQCAALPLACMGVGDQWNGKPG
jgi:hypothetical protein